MAIKAIAYLRVSGNGQIDGDGFTRQREAIYGLAKFREMEIVEEYRDEGVSGTMELENRPGLAACLAHIETNGVRVVIVESADRLARDMMVSEVIVRQFQKIGCKVLSASGNVDLTEGDKANPTAKLVRHILAAVAEFDRNVTVLKLKAARQRRKHAGFRVEGIKPFGFFTTEAQILEQILELNRQGLKSDKIANQLNESGVNSRSGAKWRGSVIRKILRRGPVAQQNSEIA